MKGEKKKSIRGDEWIEEQGLILFSGTSLCYWGRKNSERTLQHTYIIVLPISGHPGCCKTLELVMRNYWWPGISKYMLSYVDGCDVCQRGRKSFPEMPAGKLMPNPIPNAPWTDISMDFITGLPWAQGIRCNTCCVLDRFTKQVHIFLLRRRTNSLGVGGRLLWDHILKLHGLPNMVDFRSWATICVNDSWKNSIKYWGSTQKLSTAYHLQTDGQMEREWVRSWSNIWGCRVDYGQRKLAGEWLAIGEFSYNNKSQKIN